MKKTGLYIHFPFCRRTCFYCHFFKKKHQPAFATLYLQNLAREFFLRRDPGLSIDTVYIGGGSPSLLTVQQLRIIMAAAYQNFLLPANAEITLEANPEDITKQQLKAFRNLGINRLSIGVQSFQELDLRFLKRTHSAAQAVQAIAQARNAGFANISIDLIIGLEIQTARSLENNFRQIEKFMPPHLSVYILEGVPFKQPPLGGVPRSENDDRDASLYFQARQSLLAMGYQHYEVSNYCLPGKASRHNLKYWQNKPYIALGPSAAGFMDGRDYRNYSDLKKYYSALEQSKLPQTRTKQMDRARRRIITGLRLLAGIPASVFKSFSAPTDFLLSEGFLVKRNRNLAVPPEKILLLNEILGYFL
ncbi:MAG: radical SAM family heme chaperone HemW [Chrysiogenales bacterium]